MYVKVGYFQIEVARQSFIFILHVKSKMIATKEIFQLSVSMKSRLNYLRLLYRTLLLCDCSWVQTDGMGDALRRLTVKPTSDPNVFLDAIQ